MARRLAFLFVWALIGLPFAVPRPVVAQNAPAVPAQSKPNDQATSDNQAQGAQGQSAQAQNPQAQGSQGQDSQGKTKESKPADSNVFVLKQPEMPAQQQVAPELRAVDLEKRKKLENSTRIHLIQLLDAEFVRVRKFFPLGDKSLVIDAQGRVTPTDANLFQMIQTKGAAAKVGDKVQITNVVFRDKSISLELNGGPKKKSKWYQHISVGVGGSGGGVTPIDGTSVEPTGAGFSLQFNKEIPEMTLDDLKKLLSPVLDFSMKSASEVYTETLPPKVREAIKKHEVLVGMNREMVIAAKDRPLTKTREKDENGKEYEDWMYGTPPQDVVFVRFIGDEVTMVKTSKVGHETVVKTVKEVDVKDGVATLAALKASNSPQDKTQNPEEQQPPRKPTLIREGEQPETPVLQAPGQTQGQGQPSHRDEPQWGTGGKPPDDQQPQVPPRPPQ